MAGRPHIIVVTRAALEALDGAQLVKPGTAAALTES